MSPNLNPQNPSQSLSVGNVVTAGVRLYRSNLKSYFLLSLRVSLWSLLPFLVFIPAVALLYYNAILGNNYPLGWLLLVVVGVPLFFYALGKSLVNSGIISRLAFRELINQPETVRVARSQVKTKMWGFVILTILLFCIFFSLSLILGFILAISPLLLTISPLIPLLSILVFLLLLPIIIWLMARFFIASGVLAIEENTSAFAAIGRSWDLSKYNVWRIVFVLIVGLIVTIPLQIMFQLISRGIQQTIILPLMPELKRGSINAFFTVGIVYFLILLLASFVNAVILPLWQAIKAVIYYDLRSRREGLGLNLRQGNI